MGINNLAGELSTNNFSFFNSFFNFFREIVENVESG